MASPLQSSPSVHNSPPPVPPPPPKPSFSEYKTYLETTFPKKEGFHIDSANKVAIKIMDVDGKPSLVKIPLKFVDDNYVSTTLKKFDEDVCKSMVRAARSIGLGQEHPTASGKIVKAVRFEIDKKTGQVTTQKIYTNNTEGMKRVGGVVAQGSSNYYSNKESPNINKRLSYTHAAAELKMIGEHFVDSRRKEHPLPPAPQPAAPAPQPAAPAKTEVPARQSAAPEKKAKPPTPRKSIPKDNPPGDLQPVTQLAAAQPKIRTLQQEQVEQAKTATVLLGPMNKIGTSEYTYKDLHEALVTYSENGINAKMKGKDITVKDIFTDTIKNKPKQLGKSEEQLFKALEELNGG